jgi:hypothetical protein
MKNVLAAQAGQGGAVRIACMDMTKKSKIGMPLETLTAALQNCYDQFFLPIWGYPVTLYVTDKAKQSDWQFVYFDTADQAGALGYHDLTKGGQPVSKVFVKTTLDAGESVSVTACHELFEMTIDPIANLWAEGPDGTEHAYEMCDAVEEDTFVVDGIKMSNFLHPAWFEPFQHRPGTRFDHLGLLTAPFQLRKNGYEIVKKNGKVIEDFGSPAKARRFALENREGHRSEYRKPLTAGKRIPEPP